MHAPESGSWEWNHCCTVSANFLTIKPTSKSLSFYLLYHLREFMTVAITMTKHLLYIKSSVRCLICLNQPYKKPVANPLSKVTRLGNGRARIGTRLYICPQSVSPHETLLGSMGWNIPNKIFCDFFCVVKYT